MAKSKQDAIRRKLAQAHHKMDAIVDDIAPIAIMFAKDHDDMAELLRLICVSQEVGQAMLASFSMKAWGRVPKDWESWRNPTINKPKG